MVRVFIVFVLLWSSLVAQDDKLNQAVKSIIGTKSYNANSQLIGVVFKQQNSYYDGSQINYVSVVKALKENHLADFTQKSSQSTLLSFTAEGSPLLFVKIVTDSMRDSGLFKYMTKGSSLNNSEFVWNIELANDVALDPVVFGNQLAKYGCKIASLSKNSTGGLDYLIDMKNAHLDVIVLSSSNNINLERVASEKWVNVSQVSTLTISSNHANSWFPSISFYDQNLNLVKSQKIDDKTFHLDVSVPSNAVYMKITDIYTLKNIKNGLDIEVNNLR